MFIEQQHYLRKKTCIILKIKNLYQNFLTFSHLQFLFTTLLSDLLLQFLLLELYSFIRPLMFC